MSTFRYIMRDQAHDTVRDIMRDLPNRDLLTQPAWVAVTLLIVAVNLIAIVPAT